MSIKSTFILINLFTIAYSEHPTLALIHQLNNLFSFDYNVFVLESSVDFNQFIKTPNATTKHHEHEHVPQTIYTLESVNGDIKGLEEIQSIESGNTFMIIALNSSIFEVSFKQIQQIQYRIDTIKIGLFLSDVELLHDRLLHLLKWMWKARIINVFLAFYSKNLLNIFTFNPFGTFELINLTGSDSYYNCFSNKFHNLRQYPFRTLAALDSDYNYPDDHLWETIIRVLNASFTVVPYTKEPETMISDDTIDVFRYVYQINSDRIHTSLYPLFENIYVIVVPEALPYPEFVTYLRKLALNKFFGYALLTILVLIFLLSMFRQMKLQKFLIFNCAEDVNLLLNNNASIKYQQLSLKEVLLIVPLTFAGLIIVSSLISTLQSYFMRPIIQPQINTLDDISSSPYPILYSTQNIDEDNHLLTVENMKLTQKVVLISPGELFDRVYSFNTSISFYYEIFGAKILLEIQKRLNIRGYHIPTQYYISKTINSYVVHMNSPFKERFNEIIHWVRNAGLYDKWYDNYAKAIRIHKFNCSCDFPHAIDEADNSFPILALIYGWIASGVVFIVEITWKKILTFFYATTERVKRKYN